MIQGLQMLCGVVLLAVITVGQTWGAEAIDIRLQSGTMTCTNGSLHATS